MTPEETADACFATKLKELLKVVNDDTASQIELLVIKELTAKYEEGYYTGVEHGKMLMVE